MGKKKRAVENVEVVEEDLEDDVETEAEEAVDVEVETDSTPPPLTAPETVAGSEEPVATTESEGPETPVTTVYGSPAGLKSDEPSAVADYFYQLTNPRWRNLPPQDAKNKRILTDLLESYVKHLARKFGVHED